MSCINTTFNWMLILGKIFYSQVIPPLSNEANIYVMEVLDMQNKKLSQVFYHQNLSILISYLLSTNIYFGNFSVKPIFEKFFQEFTLKQQKSCSVIHSLFNNE